MASDITKEQIGILRHALGYNAETGEGREYRNHYATQPDNTHLLALVDAGLMRRGGAIPGGLVYFHVTDAGREVVHQHFDTEALMLAVLRKVREWARIDHEAAGTDAADVLGQIDDLVSAALRKVDDQ